MYAPFPALLPFLDESCTLCSMRVFSTACDLPQSPQLCQNGGLSVSSSIWGTEKSRRVPNHSSRVGADGFGKKFPCEKKV
jgi:hypothetical protein